MQLLVAGGAVRAAVWRRRRAGLRIGGYGAGRGASGHPAQVVAEEGRALVVEGVIDSRLVRATAMAQVAELQADGAARGRLVVDADCLLGWEEVVGPAILDQERGRGAGESVALMVGVDLGQAGLGFVAGGLTGVDQGEVVVEVGVGVGTGRAGRGVSAVVAGALAQSVESGDVAAQLDADRVETLPRRRDLCVEEPSVGQQGVDEIRPRPARPGGGDRQRGSLGAHPGSERPVGQANAVA